MAASTKATIAALIDNNLADNSDIVPSEHREVEDALNDSALNIEETSEQTIKSDLTLADDKVLAVGNSSGQSNKNIEFFHDSVSQGGFLSWSNGAYYQIKDSTSNALFGIVDSTFSKSLFQINGLGIITGPPTVPTDITTGVVNGKVIDSIGSLHSARSGTGTGNHQQFYNPNGLVGSIQTSGSATAFNTSSDPRLKDFLPLPDDSEIDSEWSKAKDALAKFTFKSDPSKEVYGFDAHKAIDANLKSGLGSEGEGPRDAELGSVYDTVKVSDAIPAVEEVVDKKTGEVLVEAVAEIPEVWEEKRVTPAGVDQSKLVPLLMLKLDQAMRRIEALESK